MFLKSSRAYKTNGNGSTNYFMVSIGFNGREREREAEKIVLSHQYLSKHDDSHVSTYILWVWEEGHRDFVQCELTGERLHCFNYDILVKQKLDRKPQTSRRTEIQSLKQFTLWNCLPFHLNWSPPPFFDMRPSPQLCCTMNSKSLPAVPVGAHHQRGSVTLLPRDGLPASLLGGRA